MKKIEWFWNLVHYNVYILDLKLSAWFNYINPIYWFNKLPFVKRHHAKHGVDDMNELMNSTFSNPKNGVSSIQAGGAMGGLLIAIEYGIFNIFQGFTGKFLIDSVVEDIPHLIGYLFLLMVPVILINQSLLFRKGKYLIYFEEFGKMDNKEKKLYGWISFFTVIAILLFVILSFLAI